jgi:hypothetical protein
LGLRQRTPLQAEGYFVLKPTSPFPARRRWLDHASAFELFKLVGDGLNQLAFMQIYAQLLKEPVAVPWPRALKISTTSFEYQSSLYARIFIEDA